MKLLTRLNPKSQSFTDTGGGGDLTPLDIAAACAGADDLGLRVLLTKVCGDRTHHGQMFYQIYGIVVSRAAKGGWRVPKGEEKLRALTQLAIFEAVNDFACPACNGTKFNRKRPSQPCAPCAGNGRLRLTEPLRAEVLGITRQAWYKLWNQRYREVQQIIGDHESSATRKIYRQLCG